VHPPVVALVGTPFAVLARMTSDATGFIAENTAFAVIGAVNAVLVAVVARAWGLARGAVAAGLVYAAWPVGFLAESTARLEPLGNLFLLLFLWTYGRGRDGRTRPLVLAGVFLAVLVNVKIWWCVPLLAVVVLTAVLTRRARIVVVPALAAAATALVLDLPFLVVAGPRMFRSLVTSQLHRPDNQWSPGGHYVHLSVRQRLEQLTGATELVGRLHGDPTSPPGSQVTLVVVVVVVAFLATAVLAWRQPVGRIFVGAILVQTALLLSTPIFYPYYGDYLVVTAALVIASAVSHGQPQRKPFLAWGWVAAAGLAGGVALSGLGSQASGVDWAAMERETGDVRCLVADSPYVLIRLDALDRSFHAGCRDVVDFQGLSYGAGPEPRARATLRSATPEYRAFAARYLLSGDAVVLSDYYVRVRLGAATRHAVNQRPLLVRSGNVVIHCTAPDSPGQVC
jgi:hypothetical protein